MGMDTLGATWLGDGKCRFVVWAPNVEGVEVHLLTPQDRIVQMQPGERGYFSVELDGVEVGSRYMFRLDGDRERPDPASRYQPDGVHGPSAVVDPNAFAWTDDTWRGVPQQHLVIYELHVGTFSEEGTFDGVIPYLPYLRDLGITALEILPVSQFPGDRNWGYDGVYPYGVQSTYGGPEGFRRLVDAAHAHGLAVLLDCVYNHLGPEGNYLGEYGPYQIDKYQTPWGQAINMDDRHSDEVRRYFIQNGLYWVREYHVDGFRLDATDRIIDESATHFLRAFSSAVHDLGDRMGRRVVVIAESDANDARYIEPTSRNGYGMDAQWGDDFHHALHALLTGERTGYYKDFGTLRHMAKSFRQNFYYDGVYSENRQRTHGNSPRMTSAMQFVVASQNHDQVGNRATGDRLSHITSFESAKLAAAVVLLSPYLPLIFMGEEYAETAPFQYFTSHGDPALREAVSKGRREEFAGFEWQGEVPDPQDEATFERSKLNHALREGGQHKAMHALYRELLRCRGELPALADLNKDTLEVTPYMREQVLGVHRWSGDHHIAAAFNFSEQQASVGLDVPEGAWRPVIATADTRWMGPGVQLPQSAGSDGQISVMLPGRSAVLFERAAPAQ
jgi:maltooligosyltrehalose trehalohydrolase